MFRPQYAWNSLVFVTAQSNHAVLMGRPHLMRSKLWTENDSWCLLCRKLDRPYSHKNREFVPCFEYFAVPSNSLFFQGETTTKNEKKTQPALLDEDPLFMAWGSRNILARTCMWRFKPWASSLLLGFVVWCFILNPYYACKWQMLHDQFIFAPILAHLP